MAALMLLPGTITASMATANKLHGNLSLQQREFGFDLSFGSNCHLM